MSNLTSSKQKNNNPLSLLVRMDSESIRKQVLTNIIKMIRYRGYLNKKKWNTKHINDFIKNKVDNNIYVIPLDVELTNDGITDKDNKFDNKNIYIKLISQKINSVSSSPIVNDFLKKYNMKYKIIIFDDISDKAKTTLVDYKHIGSR